MTAISNDDFGKYMLRLAEQAAPFKPSAVYDSDGDCIEFIASPEVYRAQRLDDLVTVYYGQETGKIVGSLIKGISGFRKQMQEKIPGFIIEIEDGPTNLHRKATTVLAFVFCVSLASVWAISASRRCSTASWASKNSSRLVIPAMSGVRGGALGDRH